MNQAIEQDELSTAIPFENDLSAQDEISPAALTTAEAAMRFVLAGNAYFTIRSQKTGARYTYRVSKPRDEQQAAQSDRYRSASKYFVSLLTGSDNNNDYSYIGMICRNRDGLSFRLTRASKMSFDSLPVKAFAWMFDHLICKVIPSTLEIWHEARCGRCGRRLTVPQSVALGIGPECASKM